MNWLAAAAFVRERTGLVFAEARRGEFERAVTASMQHAGTLSMDDYLQRLAVQPALLDDLVAGITVGETYFFREPGQLHLARTTILPALVARRPPGHRLRIWSAGCASGEEAYTLAIIATEAGLEPQPDILGTDLSRKALTRAAQARYGRWSLRGVAEDVVARHFQQQSDAFRLHPDLRANVDFRYLNLAEDNYPSLATGVWGMDLVLCRNVLMYFDHATVVRVARRLVDSLADDGWLLLGASDPLIGELVPCEVELTEAGLVYRRARRGSVSRAVSGAVQSSPPELAAAPTPPSTGQLARSAAPPVPAPRSSPTPTERPSAGERIAEVRALANRGDLDAAGRVCAAALDVHRDSAELHYLHAVLLAEAGRHAEACGAARAALFLDRELIVAHIVLGDAAARAGDGAAARRALRNAARLLTAQTPESIVPASDGEPAGRLAEMVRARLALLTEMAA